MNSIAALKPYLRRLIKVLAYLGLAFFCFVSVLVSSLHLFLKNESGQKWLAARIESSLLEAQSQHISLGSIAATSARSISIHDLKLYNSKEQLAVLIPTLELKISLGQLLRACLPLSQVKAPRVELYTEALKEFSSPPSSPSNSFSLPSFLMKGDTAINIDHLLLFNAQNEELLQPLCLDSRATWSPLTTKLSFHLIEKQEGGEQPRVYLKFYQGLTGSEIEFRGDGLHALSPLIKTSSLKELRESELVLLLRADENINGFLTSPTAEYRLKIKALHPNYPQELEFLGSGDINLDIRKVTQDWFAKLPGITVEGSLSWDPENHLLVNAFGKTNQEATPALVPIDSKNLQLELFLNTSNWIGEARVKTDSIKWGSFSPLTDIEAHFNWLNPSHISAKAQGQWLHQSIKTDIEIHRPSPDSFEVEKIELSSSSLNIKIDPSKKDDWALKARLGSSFLSDLTTELKFEGVFASDIELDAHISPHSNFSLIQGELGMRIKDLGYNKFSCRKLDIQANGELSLLNPNQSTLKSLLVSSSHLKKENRLLFDLLEGSTWGNPKALFYKINIKKEAQFEGLDSPFDLQTQGFIDLGLIDRLQDETTHRPLVIGIDKLNGSWSNLKADLLDPCVISIAEENIQIQNLHLDIGEGLWKGWAHITPAEILVSSEMYEVPADFLQAITGSSLRGQASGLVELDLRPGKCHAQIDMRLRKLQVSELHANLPPVEGHLKLDWHDDHINLSSKLINLNDTLSCQLTGTLHSPTSLTMWRETKGEIDLFLEGRLGLFSYLFTSQNFDFDGTVKGSLHIEGSGKSPITKGEIHIERGSYDHYPIGLTLRNIQAHLTGKGTKIHLDYLRANDGNMGVASATGDLSLLELTSSQSFLKLHRFRFLHIPLVSAEASGDCQFFHKGKSASLKGEIILNTTEIRLPDQLPSPVPQLDAYNIVYKTEAPVARKIDQHNLFKGKVEFDLIAQIPHAIVKGRGLDTTWKGNIHLKGNDEEPLLRGHIDVEHGEFAFSTKKFAVKEGYLDFAGQPLQESTIHMIAEMAVDQVTLRAMLNGPLSKPRLQFRSTPNLSMADFFSYLLFSQPHSSLSGFQALQVAQLALDASGDGSIGFFSQIRKNTGIDRLEVGSHAELGQDHEGDLYTIKVGKYLSEGILIGVSKDVSAEGTQITFELDLTKHLSLITEIGYLTSSSINLMWKKEY